MKSRFFFLLLAPVIALPLVRALAQDSPAQATAAHDHVSVRAKARVAAPADELELVLYVQGTAEEASGAEKKHRASRKRLLAALGNKEEPTASSDDEGTDKEKDKDKDGDEDKPVKKKKPKKKKGAEPETALPQAAVADEDGLVFDFKEGRYTLGVKADPTQLVDDGTGEGMTKEAELGCASTVIVSLKNLRKSTPRKIRRILARVLDVAADAGVDLAPPKSRPRPSLRFRVADPDALKKQAYSDAIAKARARAADLAKLVGRDLGKVMLVNDLAEGASVTTQTLDDARAEDYEVYLAALQAADPAAHDAASGSSEVAVEASIELEVELR